EEPEEESSVVDLDDAPEPMGEGPRAFEESEGGEHRGRRRRRGRRGRGGGGRGQDQQRQPRHPVAKTPRETEEPAEAPSASEEPAEESEAPGPGNEKQAAE